MFYITTRISTTGKALQAVEQKIQQAEAMQQAAVKKHGALSARRGYGAIYGGISALFFAPHVKVPAHYRQISQGGYYPIVKNAKGAPVADEFAKLPTVSIAEINRCIGIAENNRVMQLNFNNPTHIGFSINENWGWNVPADCIEVTKLNYYQLFAIDK